MIDPASFPGASPDITPGFHPPTVLITGAAGRIGTLAARRLAGQFPLVLSDRRPLADDFGLPFIQADLNDLDSLRACCRGVDTVLHLAATPSPAAGWDELLPNNINGTYNLFQAACEAGCRRVIYASSIMAVDGYPPSQVVQPTMPVKPSTLYGLSKAWGEMLGQYYSDQHGLSVICLRLGWVVKPNDRRLVPWSASLGFALTEADLVRLLTAALCAPGELRFGVFHGVSNNHWQRLDLATTRQVLGYEPQDDAYRLARNNHAAILRLRVKQAGRVLRRFLTRRTN